MSKQIQLKSYKSSLTRTNFLSFDDGNTYATAPHNAKFNLTGDLTLEAWIRWTEENQNKFIIAKTTGSGTVSRTFTFWIHTDETIRFSQVASSSLQTVTSTRYVPRLSWSHVAVVKNGTAVTLFVNGTEAGTGTITGTVTTNSDPLYIGQRDDLVPDNNFDGDIADVRMWDVARTETQIRENMNRELLGTESDLIAWYKIDEGTGTTLADSASSPENATVTNLNVSTSWQTSPLPPIFSKEYKKLFLDFSFSNFNKSLNSSAGDLAIELPRKFDAFNSDDSIANGNDLEIRVYDNTTFGDLLYSGKIESITTTVSDSESVTLLATGPIKQLTEDVLVDGTSLTKTWSNVDSGTVMRDIVTLFRVNNPTTNIFYTTSSIPLSGVNVSLKADSSTYLEVIEQVVSQSGVTFYFYIDTDGLFTFKEYPTTPTHLFVFGKDVTSLQREKSIVQGKSGVLFWNGLPSSDPDYVSRLFVRNSALDLFGRRILRKKDERYKTVSGAESWASSYLDLYGAEIETVRFDVVDNSFGLGYDIESINIGDTCNILNIDSANKLSSNMLITNIDYYISYVSLTVADVTTFVSRELAKQKTEAAVAAYTDAGPTGFTYDET